MKTIGAAAVQAALGLVVMMGAIAIMLSAGFAILVMAIGLVFEGPGWILGRVRKWRSSETPLPPSASSL